MKEPISIIIGQVLDLDFLHSSFPESQQARINPQLTRQQLYELCASEKQPVFAYWQTPGPKHLGLPPVICHKALIEPLKKIPVPKIEFSRDPLPQMLESKAFYTLYSSYYLNGRIHGTEGAILTEYSTNWEVFVSDNSN